MNVRKLAALDVALHGPRLIALEFATGVCLPVGLALLLWIRGKTTWQILLGSYFLGLALNYVPLLLYALTFPSREAAAREAEAELHDGAAGYGVRSLLLLLPLAVFAMAVIQFVHHPRAPRHGKPA